VSALNLVNLWSPLATEVLGHYCETEFPPTGLHDLFNHPTYGWDTSYAPEPIPDDEVLAYTTAHSPLCHVSISKWCYAAGVNLADMSDDYANTHKNDRCGKACAYMAGYTAQLINYYLVNLGVEDPYTLPPETAECKSCHFKAGNPPGSPAQCGQMDCTECHTDFMPHEGRKILLQRLWTEKLIGSDWVESNTFTGGDKIRYCLRFQIMTPGQVFVRMKPMTSGAEGYDTPSGVWKQGYFSKSDNCNDTETWRFDNGGGGYTIPTTASGQARFKAQIQVADTSAGPLLYESPLQMVYFTVS